MGARSISLALVAVGTLGTPLEGQRLQPQAVCLRWAESARTDPSQVEAWARLVECGAIGGRALAAVLQASSRLGDTVRVAQLERVLLRIQDSSVFRTALGVAEDSTASPALRIASLFVALGQYHPTVVRRPGSGFAAVLADTTETRCHFEVDRKRPPYRSTTRIPPAGPWLIATAADRIASSRAPGSVRLFARCVRLTLDETVVQPPAALVGTVYDTVGRPIGDADVVGLVSKAVARTNAAGRFALGDLAPGPEFFLVRAIGFLPQRFPATLVAGDTVPLDIVLGPAPQQLAELTVTAYGKAYTGKLAHFGHRMLTTAAPRSSFIELDELEEWAKADLAHVLRRTGLRIRIVNNRLVLSCPHENNESYTRVPLIAVYLDGALAQNEPFFDVATFPVQWIAAIEVYRRITEAPIEFQALTAGCAILITTK